MAEVFDIKNYKIINQVSGIALAHYIEPEKTTKAEVEAAGFFNKIADQLGVGSVIICSVKGAVALVAVSSNTDGAVAVTEIAAS